MTPTMSKPSKEQLLKTVQYHYERTTCKKERGRWLDKLCKLSGWERKHAIKLLSGQRGPLKLARHGGPAKGQRGGSKVKYGPLAIGVLKAMWQESGEPCGKRLKAVVALWLPSWEKRHGECAATVREQILGMSAVQMDRRMGPFKARGAKRRPAPGCEVRAQVPLRTGPWEVKVPGWIEADTVAHCGGSMAGSFAWSLVLTDIHSQWTEVRATWNHSDRVIHQRIREIEAMLPFTILGMDTDNGGEFINHALLRHWRERAPAVEVTRSRPYRKNDNAHIEQKNRTHVRALLGHERLGRQEQVEAHNRLLIAWSLWNNLYSPSLKLVGKERVAGGGRDKKTYEKEARTPAQRLLEDNSVSAQAKAWLQRQIEENDPFELKASIKAQVAALWDAQRASQPADAPSVEMAPHQVPAARRASNCGTAPQADPKPA